MILDPSVAAAAYGEFFATLTPDRLERLDRVFTPDARFLDPFNDARGVAEIARVFRHMYAHTEAPRFVVHCWSRDGDTAFYHWTFSARVRGRGLTIDGVSRVLFAADGRVREHVDYWDPTPPVYRRVPVVAALLRGLARRLTATRVP